MARLKDIKTDHVIEFESKSQSHYGSIKRDINSKLERGSRIGLNPTMVRLKDENLQP